MVLALVAAACGGTGASDPSGTAVPAVSTEPVTAPVPAALVAVPARRAPSGDATLAGQAVGEFGHDLLVAVAAGAEPNSNVVVSPLSVAVALGMLQPGASGEAIGQFADLLRIADADAWHASMNALEQKLEARLPTTTATGSGNQDGDPGELTVRIANAAYVEPAYPFLPEYLDAVGAHYGAALQQLDFRDTAAAAAEINRFIAANTDDRITDLMSPDAIRPDTVLALVNALLLYASWLEPFDLGATADGEFTRPDGSTVTVPMMHGHSASAVRGEGYVAAAKWLVGGLRAEFVLPDEGRFDEVAGRAAEAFAGLDGWHGAELVVPKFETRATANLNDPLQRLGLTAPFVSGSLLGIADDGRTTVDKVLHETWLAVDEEGIAAAAATVVLAYPDSAPVGAPPPVVLDRPFLFRVLDTLTGATLIEGGITDPTA